LHHRWKKRYPKVVTREITEIICVVLAMEITIVNANGELTDQSYDLILVIYSIILALPAVYILILVYTG
jgi:hypothetical protein